MGLRHHGYVDLPPHRGRGGFDHAAVHCGERGLYVAHTANDAVDVIDLETDRYLRSVAGLTGVAGALISETENRIFTSNRGENTVSLFSTHPDSAMSKITVGARPNGLAHDPGRGLLLCANVGDSAASAPPSITLVDTGSGTIIATVSPTGRTRWAVYDAERSVFFVNIAEPPEILVIDARRPDAPPGRIVIPALGPHGLDLDSAARRLYCACDEGRLVSLDADSGAVIGMLDLSGAPDVIFLNRGGTRMYAAIGNPGVIDVIDVPAWRTLESVSTEAGAHTLALDYDTDRVYSFLPETHRAAVFQDGA